MNKTTETGVQYSQPVVMIVGVLWRQIATDSGHDLLSSKGFAIFCQGLRLGKITEELFTKKYINGRLYKISKVKVDRTAQNKFRTYSNC